MPQAPLRWGILGAGHIAAVFAEDLAHSRTGRLVAIGSRTSQSAQAFARRFSIPHAHGSYQELIQDAQVDAVYIATPNHLHLENVLAAAAAGKHILCEKPLAMNLAQAKQAAAAAREAGVFFMEAFMYRCHPQTARLVELLKRKVIGEVRLIDARFCFNLGPKYENTRMVNAYGGGGIMDVGCYTLSLARLVAGVAAGKLFADPIDLRGHAHLGGKTRVDEWATASVRFPAIPGAGEILATLTCAIQSDYHVGATIWGTQGRIEIPSPWKPRQSGDAIIVHPTEGEPQAHQVQADGPLYAIEADTVARHLEAREAPSPATSIDDSLGNMAALDRWRGQVGLKFEGE